MNQREKEEYLREYALLKAKGKPFFPYAVAKDSIMMMIVMAIIAILLNVAVIQYKAAIVSAKESALRQDLSTLRSAIDQYTLDKKKAPQNLQELVQRNVISMAEARGKAANKDNFAG